MKTILCEDALVYLNKQPNNSISNVVTGIPDYNEMNLKTIDEYLNFFETVSDLIFKKTDPFGIIIFIQTDRKYNKQWYDKSTILNNIATKNNFKLLWHKIILKRPVGSVHLQRPTYSHFLAYSKFAGPSNNIPDVITGGNTVYSNATPVNAAKIAVEFVKQHTKSNKELTDPFVGRGTITSIAEQLGMDSIGVDISETQCEYARKLTL